jgi:prepilin-type N-terminal cleavage/methylation domain-containing protein
MTMPRERTCRNHGFTLLELIVVLTIITIISASVIPVFNGTFAGVQNSHAMRDFLASLRYAQERAITETREFRVIMDPDNNCYYTARFVNMDKDKKNFAPAEDRLSRKVFLPKNVEMKTPNAKRDRQTHMYYVSFYPNGACDEVKVSFMVNGKRAVVVSTNGTKGLILMEEKK